MDVDFEVNGSSKPLKIGLISLGVKKEGGKKFGGCFDLDTQ